MDIAEYEEVFLEYGRFISLKSWGRFNIQIPKGTTIDEYGINFPLRQKGQKTHS